MGIIGGIQKKNTMDYSAMSSMFSKSKETAPTSTGEAGGQSNHSVAYLQAPNSIFGSQGSSSTASAFNG